MKIYPKRLPLYTLCQMKNNIEVRPAFQRELVWKKQTKQLLIDTILRGYDVPKFYWEETDKDQFAVIDGQQRVTTIWDFKEDKFPLSKDAEKIDEEEIKGKKFSELSLSLKQKFDSANIDIVIISEPESQDEIRDMFLRLQQGVTLKAQERRNAMPGKMRDFIENLSNHNIFEKVDYKNIRFTYQQTAAQITLLEITGGPTDVKSTMLDRMYLQYKDFDNNSTIARKIYKILDFMNKIFKEKTPGLKNYYIISFYTMFSELVEKYVMPTNFEEIFEWYKEFDTFRIQEKNNEETDPEILTFQDKITHASDGTASIEWRHNFFLKNFLMKFPKLETKDSMRNFTDEQKRAIFYRDKQICQLKIKCNGKKLSWGNWHADHINPYSKGGKTIVENGRVSCAECNLSRGAG
tara:strand:- start:66 stop:1286 length:1221 start_codon:yes stop_codon:yes gene_type:complete